MKKVAKIERWVGGAEISLIIIAIVGVISTHVMCWIDFVSFLISTGAFLAFGVVAILPSFSGGLLEKVGWSDNYIGTILFEIGFTACLGVPLWYYHANIPGHTGFWSYTMLVTTIAFPLCFTGIIALLSRKAARLDNETQERDKSAMVTAWTPYILTKDEIEKFKDLIEEYRVELNLLGAKSGSVRVVTPKEVQWEIVDDRSVDNFTRGSGTYRARRSCSHCRWEMKSNNPEPSFALFQSAVCRGGTEDELSIKVSHSGTVVMALDGEKEFKSWQEMIACLSSEI